MRLSQTCRSTSPGSARERGGARKERNTYGDTLVLATAVYVVVACGDTEYRIIFLAEGMHEGRFYGVKITTERCFVG